MNYQLQKKIIKYSLLNFMEFIPNKIMYKIRYKMTTGRKLNLESPQRYTEKLQWYKLYYRNSLMTLCADKYQVRKYVEEKGLGNILNEIYATYNSVDEINFESLPQEFVLKLSNGTSTNIIVKDKNQFDKIKIKKMFDVFRLKTKVLEKREWVYKNNKTLILAEKYINSLEDTSLIDYKILCFGGIPAYIICVGGRGTDNYYHTVYDTKWNKVDVKIGDSMSHVEVGKPAMFDEMMNIARILSEDFPTARIDLYSVGEKIQFGEITFFPWSGYMNFTPDSFDYNLGEMFILPERNV